MCNANYDNDSNGYRYSYKNPVEDIRSLFMPTFLFNIRVACNRSAQ